jgi:hypothetical protein
MLTATAVTIASRFNTTFSHQPTIPQHISRQESQERECPDDNFDSSLPSVQQHSTRRLAWMSDGVKNGIASGLASAMVKLLLQPLDTIKTIQQSSSDPLNVLQAIQLVRNRSPRGLLHLWSGLGITIFGSSPAIAVYFGVYSSVKKRLTDWMAPENNLVAVAVAAAVANGVASLLRVPHEV